MDSKDSNLLPEELRREEQERKETEPRMEYHYPAADSGSDFSSSSPAENFSDFSGEESNDDKLKPAEETKVNWPFLKRHFEQKNKKSIAAEKPFFAEKKAPDRQIDSAIKIAPDSHHKKMIEPPKAKQHYWPWSGKKQKLDQTKGSAGEGKKTNYHLPKDSQSSVNGRVDLDLDLSETEKIENKVSLWRSRLLILAAVILFAVAAVFVANLYFDSYLTKLSGGNKAITGQIENIQKEIDKYQKERSQMAGLEKQLGAVYDLLKNHAYWSRFFTILENDTLEGVYYDNIVANKDNNQISLAVVAKDFPTAAEQIKIWQSDKNNFGEVKVSGLALSEESFDSSTLTVDKKAKKAAIELVKFKVDLVIYPEMLNQPLE